MTRVCNWNHTHKTDINMDTGAQFSSKVTLDVSHGMCQGCYNVESTKMRERKELR